MSVGLEELVVQLRIANRIAVVRMGKPQNEVIEILAAVPGASFADVAAAVGTTPATVATTIGRAKHRRKRVPESGEPGLPEQATESE